MLKNFFDVYINPDAVGWVTYEKVYNLPNIARRDVIEVFSKTGVKITRQELTAVDPAQAGKNNRYINNALIAIGAEGEIESMEQKD